MTERKRDAAALKDELCGALIGVARASESNPLVDDGTYQVLADGLRVACRVTEDRHPDSGIEDIISINSIESWFRKARDERHRLVPKCAACANPCGRTEEYDLASARKNGPAELMKIKSEVLEKLGGLAEKWTGQPRTEEQNGLLAWTLFEVGYEETPEGLAEVQEALDQN